jgi:hypothetical protein
VTLWGASFIVIGAVAAVIACLFVVRRRAPVGGYFADSTRAAGVFSVLARGVAVLLAFVIFLALQTFRTAKDTAAQEAMATTQLYRTTALLPDPGAADLRGDLVCYARAVVDDEWRTMSAGQESSTVQGWLDRMTSTIASIPANERDLLYSVSGSTKMPNAARGVVAAWVRPSRSSLRCCGSRS